jgi:hypothetical protein
MQMSKKDITRVLPVMVTEGTEKAMFMLNWSVSGNIHAMDEPELMVLKAEATSLNEEICVDLLVEQVTYYVAEEGGAVQKEATVHRLTRLFPVADARLKQRVSLETSVAMQGGWKQNNPALPDEAALRFSGECVVELAYTITEDKELCFRWPSATERDVRAETLAVESSCGLFEQSIDLALPVEFPEGSKSVEALHGTLINASARPMCGWIKVEGEVSVDITWLFSDEQAVVESFVFPLREFVEVPGAHREMDAEICADVQLFACRSESGAREGVVRGLLNLHGRLSRVEALEIPFMDDTVGPAARWHQDFHGKPHHKPFLLEEVVGAGSSQTLIEREIVFTRRVRKVREPVEAQVRNISHEIIPNKVIVRGVLQKQMFAVDAASGSVFSQEVSESFVHFVDVPGASPGMRARVRARVEYVNVNIHPGGETARQVAIVEIAVTVMRAVKKQFATAPFHPQTPAYSKPAKHSEKVYVVRSGDTVWKIANLFGVSMESIIRANNLINPNLIFPGQQLIIPR